MVDFSLGICIYYATRTYGWIAQLTSSTAKAVKVLTIIPIKEYGWIAQLARAGPS